MSYITPPSRAAGYTVTDAAWAQDIVANMTAMWPDIATTAGDMTYATAADTGVRLALGTAGTHLQAGASAPAWSNIGVPYVVRKVADESVTSSATLQDDDILLFPVAASEVWTATILAPFTMAAAGGIKSSVTCPAATTTFYATGLFVGGSSAGSDYGLITTSGGVMNGAVNVGTAGMLIVSISIANGANAGNVTFQFAQGASNGTATVCKAGAVLTAIRVS